MTTKKELEQALQESLQALKEAKEVIEELKAQKTVTVNLTREEFEGTPKRIRLRSLSHCPLNVSTEKYGDGELLSFREFGDEEFVRPDWLLKAIRAYPNTMKSGLLILVDCDSITMQWLHDEYLLDSVVIDGRDGLSQETIEAVINTADIETMLNLSQAMRDDMLMQLTHRVANNRIDLNNPKILKNIRKIKEEFGVDIMSQAEYLRQ